MNICIVGTGYVGLVSAACFAEMGNHVWCVDVNPDVIKTLKEGKIHIFEPGLEDLVRRNYEDKRLLFTTNLKEGLDKARFIFITVGTPCNPDGSCDLKYVEAVAREVGQTMTESKIIVDKSTVPVGTADKVRAIVKAELDKRGLDLEFDVASNPEFLKEGDAVSDFMKPDRVVVGTEKEATCKEFETLYAPYARSRSKMIFMGTRSAEMTKYAANCMLATKISFINEMAGICEKVGANVREVRLGIGSDHRIGYYFIYPGVGYGGSCFPKDVKALINTAKEVGARPELIEAVDSVNNRQKKMLSRKILDYFEPQGGVKGKTLAIWGLAFKANTDDMRESSALSIITELTEAGMKIKAFDPVAHTKAEELLRDNDLVEIVHNQYEVLEGANAVAVVTDWNQFRNPDFDKVKEALLAPVIFDGRNLYDPSYLGSNGFAYFSVGRRPVGNLD
ncbi:UDP-glucose dehydrogenase family protein [Maridesulfovibrio frigidus]|uniref:UDP-glucose dehydrogenase family protein n=1 Tax=Maridesulfovibrio frigidus TaxID=340956 RepID=UPI0004E13C36|nr:UDP-glucose/GDP-mannose dehydrogenase family protein [Maridesulfovibrio frigidus]